jgi:branched-chain amino acid transport system permease protein
MTGDLLQYAVTGLSVGATYAMVALGFNIIYNATGIINFAQGEFVMLGGMTAVWAHTSLHWPMGAAAILAVAVVMVVGVALHELGIRPLRRPTVLNLIILTIGASILIKGAAMLIWGKEAQLLPAFSGETPIRIGNAVMTPQTLWVLASLGATVVVLSAFFRFTLAGKAMQACAFNAEAAALTGIRRHATVRTAFALSAAIGGLAGVVITPITLMTYDRGSMLALKGFAVAILGGLGNPAGAVVGGLLVGILESVAAGLPFRASSSYKDAVALVALLAVLFARPGGLLGRGEAHKLRDF